MTKCSTSTQPKTLMFRKIPAQPIRHRAQNPDFVREVNLAYHEEESAVYSGQHPEIFREETGRWSGIAERISALRDSGRPLRILDVGVGTGFVPLSIGHELRSEDEVVMTDLSEAMLDVARSALSEIECKKTFMVSAAKNLDFTEDSFDAVTMNSVLHHLPDGIEVLTSLSATLRSGGLIVVAHEPNVRHFNHLIIGGADRFLRFLKRMRYRKGPSHSPFIDRVNARLMEADVIQEPMTVEEIESLVDIQSPTAGRTVRRERGFDPLKLGERLGLETVLLETYRHLGKVGPAFLRRLGGIPKWLETRFPHEGALFTLILRKP